MPLRPTEPFDVADVRRMKTALDLRRRADLAIAPEVLVDAKVLKAKNRRRAAELKRMRDGFKNLESLGLLTIEGAGWPFRVHLSRRFFHEERSDA
jgi:hypothetical protein